MSPRKLTPDDKQEILKLYRETSETTSTLAERFGVSSSTISRFLKAQLSDQEYEDLIQQKRLARTHKLESEPETLTLESPALELSLPVLSTAAPVLADRKVAPVVSSSRADQPADVLSEPLSPAAETADLRSVESLNIGDLFDDDLDELEDDEDDDLDDLEEDEDEDEWDDEDNDSAGFEPNLATVSDIQVHPLSDAIFPRTCYLVIDRTAELIARPLKEFSHLGTIPPEETQQKTLPVFDNHRIAKRFSNRFQRIIKLPDGKLLYKTSPHLQAKGITRILIDGRIYALPPS